MMKKIIIILTVLTLFSCEDLLVEEPKSIAVETFYNTKLEVESAIAAIYAPLRSGSMFGWMYQCQVEAYADYWQGRGSWAILSDYQGLNVTNIGRTDGAWPQLYQAIRNANLVIMNAPKGKELSEADITTFVAEAKYLRAFSYFILAKNWGGVPVRTEANFTDLEVGRNSVEEVYELIFSDLEDAELSLPDNAPIPGRASKWVAKTLLADIYFFLGRNGEAATKANEVIAANKYSLVPVTVVNDFYKIYGTDVVTSTEEIFYIKFSHENGSSYPMMLHHPGSKLCGGGGWYGLYADSQTNIVIKNWDANDLRRGLWYSWNIGLGANSILSLKFIDPTAPTSGTNSTDFPVYRYADVLLLSAEAECLSTGAVSAAAMEKLNMVHRRAYGYNPLETSPVDFNLADYTADSFADLVVQERCYETQCEGKRWFDLKRLGTAKLKEIIQTNTGKVVADKHLLWPIPVAELAYNKKIDPATDQNPGY